MVERVDVPSLSPDLRVEDLRRRLARMERGPVLVGGTRALLALDHLAEASRGVALPPSRFVLLHPVTADVLRRWPSMLRGLYALGAAHHVVQLASVSLPSFSDRELAHLAPDSTVSDVVRAVAALLELEARAALRFRDADFDTVLFTPWTTLVDVEINLRLVRDFGLASSMRELLRAELELPAGSAVLQRAIAQGRAHEDGTWTYSDPRVAEIAALARTLQEERDPTVALESLLSEVIDRRGGADPRRSAAAPLEMQVLDADFAETARRIRAVGLRQGVKPVWRPTVGRRGADAMTSSLREQLGSDVIIRSPRDFGEVRSSLVVGYDEDAVRELPRIMALEDPSTRDHVRERCGVLLGYPPCCAKAFVAADPWEENLTEKAVVLRRGREDGPLDPRWVPLMLLHELFLPCSLRCAASLASAATLQSALQEAGIGPPQQRWEQVIFLVHLEVPGNTAILLRLADTADGFRYRAAGGSDSLGLLAPVFAGDRIAFGTQTATVLREDEVLHVYAGDVAVLDVTRIHGDAQYWRGLEQALRAAVRGTPDQATADDAFDAVLRRVRPSPPFRVRRRERGRSHGGERTLERAVFDAPDEGFVLTLVPSASARGVAARFVPGPRLPEQRALTAYVAEALEPRSAPPADPSAAWRHAVLLEATYPPSGELRTFAGFAATWPVAFADGTARVALVRGDRALQLISADLAEGWRWPGRTASLGVGYEARTVFRDALERAAFRSLLGALREAETRLGPYRPGPGRVPEAPTRRGRRS